MNEPRDIDLNAYAAQETYPNARLLELTDEETGKVIGHIEVRWTPVHMHPKLVFGWLKAAAEAVIAKGFV